MRLGDVLSKEDWSPSDREIIRREMNNLQQQVSALTPLIRTPGQLHLSRPYIEKPEWLGIMSDFARIVKVTTHQSIPNTTETAITWNKIQHNLGSRISIGSTSSHIELAHNKGQELWMLFGWIGWEEGAEADETGQRRVRFAGDGGSGNDLFILPGRGYMYWDKCPFCNLWQTDPDDTYVEFIAWQDSGDALDLTYNSQVNMLYLGRWVT